MLKPRIPNKLPPKTLRIKFETWNSLKTFGDPEQIIEDLLQKWMAEFARKQENYFLDTTKIIQHVTPDKTVETTEDALIRLRNLLAQANAMHWTRKAEKIKTQIHQLEAQV